MSNKFIKNIQAGVIFITSAVGGAAHADNQLNLTSSLVDRNPHTEETIDLAEQAEKQGCVGTNALKSDAECFEAKAGHIKTDLAQAHLNLNGIEIDAAGYFDAHSALDESSLGVQADVNFHGI